MKVNNTLQYPLFTKRCGVIHFLSSFRLLLGCMKLTYYCIFQYGTVRGLQGALGKPYLTYTFRKLVLVVLNINSTVYNFNIKKSGTITGKAAILEPQNETNIWRRNPKTPVAFFSNCNYRITKSQNNQSSIRVPVFTLLTQWTTPDKQKSDRNLQWRNAILSIARLILNRLSAEEEHREREKKAFQQGVSYF